ncbi:hypothetical protein D3C84_1088360 [compost metagenome]
MIINGTKYSGGSVVISGNVVGGDLYVDGVRPAGTISFKAPMSIKVEGDVERLETVGGNVHVTGWCRDVITTSGNVTCGDVSGDVETIAGSVKCSTVSGKVKTMSGGITMRR